MTIERCPHDRENPYTQINKFIFTDPDLSWEAKGLLAYFISLPNDWKINVSHLVKIYKGRGGGEKSIYKMINELIEAGYCTRTQVKNENGHFTETKYHIREFKKILPNSPKRDAVEPSAVKGDYTKEEVKLNTKENVRKRSDVPSFIQEIDGITDEDKKILSRYPEENVKAAIEYSKVVPPIESKIKQLMYFSRLDKPVKIPKNPSNHLYEYLVEWSRNNSSSTCTLRIDKKSVTFEHSGQGLDKPIVRFVEEEASEKIGRLLKQYKFKPNGK